MTADYSDLRILLVDDQPHVRKYVRDVLASIGVEQVTEAASGRAAMQAVTEPGAVFDLILCDLVMADKDGIETIRAMASMGLRCAVAILSVEDSRVIESVGLLAKLGGLNLVGAVSKPLTVEKLVPLLQRTREAVTPSAPVANVVTESEIAEALKKHQFEVAFQPQIQMKSGDCTSVEATLHWKHPRHGVLDSVALMPLAAGSPALLAQLTTLTLRESMAACGRWRADGHELSVAVNLSPLVFGQLNLPELIEQGATEYEVPASAVTIEVAETTLIPESVPAMLEIAARLRIKGFQLALDEFTGGSSGIQDLLKIPFNELKLSATVVSGVTESNRKRAVVEAGLALARSLKVRAVAVGVQSRPEWNLLADLGCDLAQGDFLAQPMSGVGLNIWMTKWMLHQR
jgi:EAL domain-containing protein (putative c-di-GMP-specific phosphodiesterase class I)